MRIATILRGDSDLSAPSSKDMPVWGNYAESDITISPQG